MQLKELLKDIKVIDLYGSLDTEVSDITCYTGDVRKGGCFVAITGNLVDGHDYVHKAIENGARVIVGSKSIEHPEGVANVIVEDPREALALMSARLFGEPSRSLKLVGITGTNGKTTIAYLLEAIWKACGKNPGVVGTINYRYGSVLENPKHTTPESYELQSLFRDMLNAGIDSVAMEVSSHSLDQDRVLGCNFDGAVFTNLTQDHLDYHLNMERYKSAKAQLFKRHLPASSKKKVWAVINKDDPAGDDLAKELPYTVYRYSVRSKTDVYLDDASYSLKGTDLKVKVGGEPVAIKSNLIGRHNVSNILAAVAAAHAMRVPLPKIKDGIQAVKRVPGRLEPVPNSKGLNVLIDYAHTPDALKNVTTALKELKPARLITVFGCGGDRDRTKRPLMGYETALKSDVVIITSDNPRSENPRKIIEEIIAGVKKGGLEESKNGGPGYIVEENRREAIAKAIKLSGPRDLVLIAGKGHEDYQIIGEEKLPFDDLKVAEEIIEETKTFPLP